MRWIPIKRKLPPADIDVVLYDADINSLYICKAGEERGSATHWLPLKKVQEKGDIPFLPKGNRYNDSVD